MGFIRNTAASFAMLIALASGRADAAALETDVDVTIPSVVVLSCYDSVEVDVSAESFLTAVDHTPGTTTLSRNARGRNGRLVVNAPRRTFRRGQWTARRSVDLNLTNICAFRAVGQSNRGVLVSVTAKERILRNGADSQMRVRRVRARDTEKAGNWRRRYRIRNVDLGWGKVRGIDVQMRLDTRNARMAGTYSSDTDGTFEVTVVASP